MAVSQVDRECSRKGAGVFHNKAYVTDTTPQTCFSCVAEKGQCLFLTRMLCAKAVGRWQGRQIQQCSVHYKPSHQWCSGLRTVLSWQGGGVGAYSTMMTMQRCPTGCSTRAAWKCANLLGQISTRLHLKRQLVKKSLTISIWHVSSD